MNFYENLVELDLNPIISFSSNGKILYSNSEAQFVLNRVNKKELFEIAVKNASTTYGTKTTYLNLNLKTYSFYAITVSYENEDELILKLYKSISMKKVVIPRIGIRKVVGKAVDTKVGAGTDTAVSVVAKKTGDVLNFVGRKTGLNKLKIETPANKKARKERKNLNLSTQGKIVQSQKNLVEQEVRDIQSDKDWEKEKEEMDAYIASAPKERFPVDDVQPERRDGGRL